jgi:hypothetical protein
MQSSSIFLYTIVALKYRFFRAKAADCASPNGPENLRNETKRNNEAWILRYLAEGARFKSEKCGRKVSLPDRSDHQACLSVCIVRRRDASEK